MEQGFSFSTLKKLAAEPDHTDVSLTAAERVLALSKMGCSVEINEEITPRRYFRSGVEMERMAAVYLEEGSLENAYVLYNKFITLFVEKLPSHRDYRECSVPEKQVIMKKLQDVAFPRKDQLRKLLHEKFNKEHAAYLMSQSQAVVVDGCGQQLQRTSLVEQERLRVAQLRRMQMEAEQFRYFEDQLRRQELANRRDEAVAKVPEQTDGSCLSHSSKNHVRLDPNRNQPCLPSSKPAATLAGVHTQLVEGLRRVVIPRDLTYKFLLLADSNTARGIETCGVLCGKLTQNEFLLTHVVVPKQSAGPDYCDMENVEELFSFQDHHSLLTLGWIHTHPTQTAFLSSVDLHTHGSYQLMLPEAIAIVCSPKHNDTGVFRLTSSGMGEVARCRLKGFHPHSKDPPLFSICRHVVIKDLKTTVLDLR
ncbi:AMSH-like protease isoform X2 [Salmo salar]|uniref:AMSH-like protease isoform X2 n=1 Tax=Salmo salar TaxID=8030 RepID=A0A1S3NE97_SALSA|nr:AMSH-like protease isoform X2 [Salmo salar]XP_045558375.1 AMSH-like protease isoform X2 [Salmo salar]|eukprot:XP_014013764.1 PREDICTED: AMSH-like protease isoform X2 [Salmo salar]